MSATQASVAITVESIAQEAAKLQAQVRALQTAGMLNQGRAQSLIVKLNLQGNHGDSDCQRAEIQNGAANAVIAGGAAGIVSQAVAVDQV